MLGLAQGGMKVAGTALGAIAGAKAAREQKALVNQQLKENQQWYDRRYNEDSTERADAVAALQKQKEAMAARSATAAGTAAVMGGTNESAAAEKAAQTAALGDTIGSIAIAGEARKENIENKYMSQKSDLMGQLGAIAKQKGDNIAAAASQIGSIGSDMMGGLLKK